MTKDYRQYFILINSNSISSFLNEKTFTGKIKICSLYKINWTSTQIKNNLDRLIKIFKSEDQFDYNSKDDLFLIYVETLNKELKIIIDNNSFLNVSAGLNQLINKKGGVCITTKNSITWVHALAR